MTAQERLVPQAGEHLAAGVAFDPEVAAAMAQMPQGPPLAAETLAAARAPLPSAADVDTVIGDRDIEWVQQVVPGPAGAPGITVLIMRPRTRTEGAPAIFSIHGGGMMLGDRFSDVDRLADLVEEFGLVAVSPEYRLAPEHPFPAGLEDCYAGLTWLGGHTAQLGVAADRIVVMGGSAGGGLAAGLALLTRDRGGPHLAGQVLLCPMIDDRNNSESTLQYADGGPWTKASNELGLEQPARRRQGRRGRVPVRGADPGHRPGRAAARVHRGRRGRDLP